MFYRSSLIKEVISQTRNKLHLFRNCNILYDKNFIKYSNEIRKWDILNNCNDKKKEFVSIIKNREIMSNLDDNLYKILSDTISYLLDVYEEDIKKAGQNINYTELMTKLCLLKTRQNKLKEAHIPGHSKRANVSFRYVEGTKSRIIDFDNFVLNYEFSHLPKVQQYDIFLHEIFHIIDIPLKTTNGKLGLLINANKFVNFIYLFEGNSVRRTSLVLNRMIENGYNFRNFQKFRNPIYNLAEKRVNRITSEFPKVFNANYGSIEEFQQFINEYNSKNSVTLQDEELHLSCLERKYINSCILEKQNEFIKYKNNLKVAMKAYDRNSENTDVVYKYYKKNKIN